MKKTYQLKAKKTPQKPTPNQPTSQQKTPTKQTKKTTASPHPIPIPK